MLNFYVVLLIAIVTQLSPIKAFSSPRPLTPRSTAAHATHHFEQVLASTGGAPVAKSTAPSPHHHQTEGDAIAAALSGPKAPGTVTHTRVLPLPAPVTYVHTAAGGYLPVVPSQADLATEKAARKAIKTKEKASRQTEKKRRADASAADAKRRKTARKESRRKWYLAGVGGGTLALGGLAAGLAVPLSQAQQSNSSQSGQINTLSGQVNTLQTAVGSSTDTASATGSLYARTAQDANALALKADTTALTAGLGLKADTTALTTGLAAKADTTALTAGLATKAEAADLTALAGTVNNSTTGLAATRTALTALTEEVDNTTTGLAATRSQALETHAGLGQVMGDVYSTTRGLATKASAADFTTLSGTVDNQLAAANTLAASANTALTAIGAAGDGTAAHPATGLFGTVGGLSTRTTALEGTVGSSSGGLVKDVAGLKTAVGGSTDAANPTGSLYARSTALQNTAGATTRDLTEVRSAVYDPSTGLAATRSTLAGKADTAALAGYETTAHAGSAYQAKGNYASAADLTALRGDVGSSTDAADTAGSLYARSRALGTQVSTAQTALAGKADRSDVYDSSGTAKYQTKGDYVTTAAGNTAYQARGNYATKDDVYDSSGTAKYQTRGDYVTTAAGNVAYQAKGDYVTTAAGNAAYQTKGDYVTTTAGNAAYQAKGNYASAADLTALRGDVGSSTDAADTAGSLYARSRALGSQVLTTQGALAGKADASALAGYETTTHAGSTYQARGNYANADDVYTRTQSDVRYTPAGYSYSKSESNSRYTPFTPAQTTP